MSTQYHIDMLNEMIENKLLYSYCEDLRAAAARLAELERENARLREALKPFAEMNIVSFGQRRQGMGPYLTSVWFDGYSTPVEKHQRARAALAAQEKK